MSEKPTNPTPEARKATFKSWLNPIKPSKPARATYLSRIAPWRHEFADAVAAGYTWAQLAKEIAPKPEIGVTISGDYLKKCVRAAFVAANEKVPVATHYRRRRKRAEASPNQAPNQTQNQTTDQT